MKKLLLASSILAATAGFASAEVALSGSARMGLIYDETTGDTLMTSRVRVVFSMSGETDGGLSFGASVRNDQTGQGNTANGDSTVFISGAFGKLTFGDVDSAANALVGNVSGVGLTGLGDWNELGYLGQTKTAALYEYSTGAITVAASKGQLNGADDAASLAVKYAPGTFSVALGYEATALVDHVALGASATFGAATVKFVASDTDAVGRDAHFAVSLDYAMGATTLTVFGTEEDGINNFGIGASHDLGGGAKIVGGLVSVDNANVDPITLLSVGGTRADIGLSFSF